MKNDLARYTMRVERDLLSKFYYVAQYEGRTANKQLERIIKRHVAAFEKKNGEITDDMIAEMYSAK